jgi:hypothetical protein
LRLRRRAATARSRLGLRTSLAAAFGDDDYGDFCWRTLIGSSPRSRAAIVTLSPLSPPQRLVLSCA